MRSFPRIASRALILVLAALFAGCSSTSTGSAGLPLGTSATSQSTVGRPGPYAMLPKGRITPLKLLKLQAEGRLPGPMPRKALEWEFRHLQTHARPHLSVRRASGTVSMWVSDTEYGYLSGENRNGKKTITDIDAESEGCYYPVTLKVDSSQNLWTSCEYNSGFSGSEVQEYSSEGALEESYVGGCPAPVSSCDYFYAYSFDESANSSDVFTALDYFDYETATTETYGGGFEWWPTNEPSASPTLIAMPYCSPVCDVYYMDLDSSGDIWFDYYGYNSSDEEYGYGLGEVTNPTTSPTFVAILPVGTLEFPGGVYVSDGGSVLNVTDQDARTTAQYHLPLSPSGAPFNTLGPTKEDVLGLGDPVSGGFNQAETKMAFGDAYGWIDRGTVSSNAWRDIDNPGVILPEGAAYTPSDR
jgi:hypothetical protein